MFESIFALSSSPLQLVLSLAGGLALGAFFFGGLHLTVRHLATSRHPVVLALSSLLCRMAVTCAGFLWIGGDRWERYVAALLGFLVTRIIMLRAIGKRPEATSQ
jgi:F1F0 ATPase subunit 2